MYCVKCRTVTNMYCVKCRTVTNTADAQNFITKNRRPMIRGRCVMCGGMKTQFVSLQKGGDLVSSLSTVTSGVKLPWTKFEANFIWQDTALQDLALEVKPRPDAKGVV